MTEHVGGTEVLGAPVAVLDANLLAFQGLVQRARRGLGRPAYAAAMAQAAAEFAWFNHTGWYASPDLEELVGGLGRRLPAARPGRGRLGTLHVATQAYQTGGSTQAIVAWTDEVSHRRHHLALTRQGAATVPEKVASRVGDRFALTRLDRRPGSLLARAARLRTMAAAADLVLVHAHPYDVVPALAFADRPGLPPVVYVDHADHVFWLGVTAVDHVAHMRHSGRQLAIERRGLPAHRSLLRNRPLAFSRRSIPRAEAKSQWGLAPGAVLLLSAAEPTKFARPGGEHLASLVEPVLLAHPDLHWFVAGPRPDDEPWAALATRTGGRARAVGRVDDMSTLHQAADLFLDSFPFSSLTSMLESGALENPLVTFRGHPSSCAVFGADSPGIDDLVLRPVDAASLERDLALLVGDAEERASRGRATAAAVRRSHGGPDWVEAAESLHDLPAGVDSTGLAPLRDHDDVDRMTASVMASTAHCRDAAGMVGSHLGAMPARARWSEWRASEGVSPTRLAPDWLVARSGGRT